MRVCTGRIQSAAAMFAESIEITLYKIDNLW
jgi:hypothetical protein